MAELLTSIYETPDISIKYPGVEPAQEDNNDSFEDFNKMFFETSNKVLKLKDVELPNLEFPSNYPTTFLLVKLVVKLPTSNTSKYIKEYLMSNYGLDAIHASALVGVWQAESGLNPGVKSKKDSGSGIALWTGPRHKVFDLYYEKLFGKKSPGIVNTSLEEQIDVAIAEYKGRTKNWQDFLSRKDLRGATDSVLRGYENGGTNALASIALIDLIYTNVGSGNYNSLMKNRLKFAEQALKALRGGKL